MIPLILIIIIIVAANPSTDVVREHCDMVELNHFYDDDRRLVFDQLLFYDWSFDDGRYQLRAWRMVKDPAMLPRYNHFTLRWVCDWNDGDLHRRITANVFRETWTQFDPELTERAFLPKEKRRELAPVLMRRSP